MRILFQGDSVTDSGRDKTKDSEIGFGYTFLVKSELGYKYPEKYEFISRGVGGNRIVDLYARIKKDIINVKPDVVSILVGINDVLHEIGECPNGIDAEKYYNIYCLIIEEIKKELPNTKIMIMEPFFLPNIAREPNCEYFDRETRIRAKMARKVAEKFSLPFIPLQEGFDELCKKAPPEYWLHDGVHPTSMGYVHIKDQWIKAFNNL